METFKKALCEFCGTLLLVLIGCGSAVFFGASEASGVLLIAFAFGLALLIAAYTFGSVSGGHFNPAVSFAMLICGRMTLKDFFVYLAAQFAGGAAGAGLLALILDLGSLGLVDKTGTLGSNGVSTVGNSYAAAILTEILLSFAFVFAVLHTAHKEVHKMNGGLICALSLTAVHLFGIRLTGTSVNPARSFGPALVSAFKGTMTPIVDCWVFIAAPLAGAALASMLFRFLAGNNLKR